MDLKIFLELIREHLIEYGWIPKWGTNLGAKDILHAINHVYYECNNTWGFAVWTALYHIKTTVCMMEDEDYCHSLVEWEENKTQDEILSMLDQSIGLA